MKKSIAAIAATAIAGAMMLTASPAAYATDTTEQPAAAGCQMVAVGPQGTNANGLWSNVDTRSAGHYEYVDGGLHVWTTDATSQAKVSLGTAVAFPLADAGALAVEYTNNSPETFPYGPGLNLFVDFDADGTNDGTLVYESVYGQDLWLTGGSKQFAKDAAPSHTGGNGSENHGTIDQWVTAFPEAKVLGIAFALGSGVHADGVITAITAGCTTYTFDFAEAIQVPAKIAVTPHGVEFMDECGTMNDGFFFPEPQEGVVRYDITGSGFTGNTVTAVLADGYVLADGAAGRWEFPPLTDKPCETTPPTEPTDETQPGTPSKSTPAGATTTSGLADTGFDGAPLGIAAAVTLLLGGALVVGLRIARRRTAKQ